MIKTYTRKLNVRRDGYTNIIFLITYLEDGRYFYWRRDMNDNEGFVMNSTSTSLVTDDELDRLASVLFTSKSKPLLISYGTYDVDVDINYPKTTLEFTVFRYGLYTTSYFMFYPENEYGRKEWDGVKYTIEDAVKAYPPSRYEWYYKDAT